MTHKISTPTSSPGVVTRKNMPIMTQNKNTKMDPDLELVISQAQKIADYFVAYHLRKECKHESLQGLPKSYLVPPAQPSELQLCVARLSACLEKHDNAFFQNVPQHMKLKRDNAKRVYYKVCSEIVNGYINWGRVMTIYTLGGTMAVFFTNKGQLDVVQKIPGWIKEMIETFVAEWILENGGWDGLVKTHGNDNQISASWSPYFTTLGVLAAAGMLFLGFRK